MLESQRTAVETVFEKYLNSQFIPFEFEKEHPGKGKLLKAEHYRNDSGCPNLRGASVGHRPLSRMLRSELRNKFF